MRASVGIWARSLVASSVRNEMPSSESRGCPTSVGSEIPSSGENRGCQLVDILSDSELRCTCCVSSVPEWMLEHDLSGHRPNRSDCPYCVQAGDGVKTLQLPGPSHPHSTIVTLACRLPP